MNNSAKPRRKKDQRRLESTTFKCGERLNRKKREGKSDGDNEEEEVDEPVL